jgi:hypothetical protein
MERDVTGEVAVRTASTIKRLRERFASRVPYGPMREYLTAPEQRKQLQDMDSKTKIELQQSMTPEQWSSLMKELYGW